MSRPGAMAGGEPFSLTPVQHAMVVQSLGCPGEGVNMLQIIVSVRHEFDVGLVARAVRELVAARPALRTVFSVDAADRVSQSVLDHADVPLATRDLGDLDEPARLARKRRYLDEDKARGFDFAAGPPTRFAVFRCGEREHDLVWTVHHALIDGRSATTLVAELFALYDGMAAGRAVVLPSRPGYAEFVQWLSERDTTTAAAFWGERLAGVLVPTPLDLSPPRRLAAAESAFASVTASVTEKVTARLLALAAERGVTANNLVQVAWSILLGQLSGRHEVVFGATRACRSFAPDAAERIGVFFNTVPFRVRVADECTVGELLGRVRAEQVALREFEHCAPAQIRSWTGVAPGNALFDSIVVFENHQYNAYLRDLAPEWRQREIRFEEQPGYPLVLSAYRGPRLELKLSYDRRRVSDDRAGRLLRQVETLLDAIAATPDAQLRQLPALAADRTRGTADLEPVSLPRRHRTADTHRSRHEVTVLLPERMAGRPVDLLAAVLAFLARLAGGSGRAVGLYGHAGFAGWRVFRLPALGPGQSFAGFCLAVADELGAARPVPADPAEFPILVDILVEGAVPEDPCPGAALAVQVDDRATSCRMVATDDLLVHGGGRALGAALQAWLGDVAGPGGDDLTTLPMLSETDRRRLTDWNDTIVEHPGAACVHELISLQATRRPDAPAVLFAGETLSYAELDRGAARVAAMLRSRGAHAGDLVGVHMRRSAQLVVALLGVLRVGAAFLPLDPSYPPARIEQMIRASGARLVLTDADVARAGAYQPDPAPLSGNLDEPAYVIYTSGSTGRPKGVQITHRNLANLLAAVAKTPGCTERDTLLAITTVCFDIAYLELFLPLVTGGRVEIAAAEVAADAFELRSRIEANRPTIVQATPATWRMLVAAGWTGDGRLKALSGGEALPRDLADDLLARCGEVWNLYGPTETTIWSTVAAVRTGTPVTIGRPIDNTRCFVLDPWGGPVLPGMPGELFIGGAGVGAGYRGEPDRTARRFVPGPDGTTMYRTGDLVRHLPDGQLVFLDRVDDQVKVHGHRVEPGEVEAALRAHDAVADAVVVREDTSESQRLVGYVVPADPAAPAAPAALREYLGARLPRYLIPATFVHLPALPRTPNGKIDRRALPRRNVPVDATAAKPTTRIELAVAGVWREVLGVPGIGLDDNFFDAGGDSLLLMRLVAKLRAEVDESLRAVDVLGSPTVRAIAERLGGAGQERAPAGHGRSRDRHGIRDLRQRRARR